MTETVFDRSVRVLSDQEEDHYYPFGLTMVGISDKALKNQYAQNKYKYNCKELQSKEFSDQSGLEEYDYGARYYDPQLGTWHSIDSKTEMLYGWSPYVYCNNDPNYFIDKDGKFLGTIIGGLAGGIAGGIDAAIHHKNFWKGAKKGAISGAIAGAVVDLTIYTTGTGTAALVAAGAFSGAAGNAVSQGLNLADGTQKFFSFKRLGASTLLGGALGFAGAKAGAYVADAAASIDATSGVSGGRTASVIAGETESVAIGNQSLVPIQTLGQKPGG